MCLDRVEKTGLNEAGFGYKVFKKKPNGRVASMFWEQVHGEYDFGKWIKDNNMMPLVGYSKYKPGFHIFKEYPAISIFHARLYTIKRVKFRNGHTTGYDWGIKTVVCGEMKIKKFSLKVTLTKWKKLLDESNGVNEG
jgi:hypothetical protein